MSACDRLAAVLKRGRRAVLVGGPTEGAGASQQESKDQTARWLNPDGLVGVSIPNAAMGVQTAAAFGVTQATAEQFFDKLAFENRPVEPDEFHATTREDVVDRNRGWLQAARDALQHAERAGPVGPAGRSRPRALTGRSLPSLPSEGFAARLPPSREGGALRALRGLSFPEGQSRGGSHDDDAELVDEGGARRPAGLGRDGLP